MPIPDLVPADRPALPARVAPAYVRVEPAVPARRSRPESRTGEDGRAYRRYVLPPYRGRLFDFFV